MMRVQRRRHTRCGPRGYTLIELTVALVMAAIVTTAGLSAFAIFNRQRVRIERASTADDIAKTVLQYLIRESQRVGGASLRPWQAIAVEQDPCGDAVAAARFTIPCEDSPDGLGPDRLTFAFADDSAVFSACEIKDITDTVIQFKSFEHEGLTGCCNQFRFVDDTDEIELRPLIELKNQHLMLSSTGSTGTAEETYVAVTYKTAPVSDAATCKFNYVQSGQAFPLASTPRPDPAVDFDSGFFKGNAIPIKIATAYVGCSSSDCVSHPEDRALFLFSDRNAGAGTTTVLDDALEENFVLSPNIVDLQVALGYDNDEDGEVVESESGQNDDYAGNFADAADSGFSTATASLAEAEATLTGEADVEVEAVAERTTPNPRLLRMIRLGVVGAVKVNDPNYQTSAQLPGGGVHNGAGLHLRAMSSKAAFRSLNLLE